MSKNSIQTVKLKILKSISKPKNNLKLNLISDFAPLAQVYPFHPKTPYPNRKELEFKFDQKGKVAELNE